MFEILKQLSLRNNKNAPMKYLKLHQHLYQKEMQGPNLSLSSLLCKISCEKYVLKILNVFCYFFIAATATQLIAFLNLKI